MEFHLEPFKCCYGINAWCVSKCKSAECLVWSKNIDSHHFGTWNLHQRFIRIWSYIPKFYDSNVTNGRRTMPNASQMWRKRLKNYLRSEEELFINTRKQFQFGATFLDYARVFKFESQYKASCFIRSKFRRVLSLLHCFPPILRFLFLCHSYAFIGQHKISSEGKFPAVHFKFYQDFVCLLVTFASWLFMLGILAIHFICRM